MAKLAAGTTTNLAGMLKRGCVHFVNRIPVSLNHRNGKTGGYLYFVKLDKNREVLDMMRLPLRGRLNRA